MEGTPTGISPHLYTADIGSCLNNNCQILQYADDIALYVTDSSIVDAASSLCLSLDSLNQWLLSHGLSLSAPKSSAVIFSRKRRTPHVAINILGQNIPIVNKVKFLGVILDSKLTGKDHINFLIQRCERTITILKVVAGVWWGAHPYTMKLVYNALVRSVLDYGTYLLTPCNKGALVGLDKVQSKCLRIISGCMKSSPINALQVECAEPPLALRRQYLASRFLSRLICRTSHPLIEKLYELDALCENSNYWKNKETPLILKSFRQILNLECPIVQFPRLPLFNFAYEVLSYVPKIVFNIGISKKSPSANLAFNAVVGERWNGFQLFFTDASKLTDLNHTGAAVFYQSSRIILQFKCPKESSVFTGECVAILEACLFIESHHNIHKAVIFTDSLSCLQALIQNPFKSKLHSSLVLKIKASLLSCAANQKEVQLVWIPSHCGIKGNECVDTLAKDACSSTVADLSHNCLQGYDLLNLPRTKLQSSWQEQWDNTGREKGRFYHSVQPIIKPKPWFYGYKKVSKPVISVLCRIRLGFCCTPVFLQKIRIRDSSLCECGLDEGTLDHIFFECSNNIPPLDLYSRLPKFKIPLPTNFSSLLTYSSPELLVALMTFIRHNNIKL